jgi:hypothetical protein
MRRFIERATGRYQVGGDAPEMSLIFGGLRAGVWLLILMIDL